MEKNNDIFAGKNVLVMGLGRFGGGVGMTKFLVDRHANVTVTDTADPKQLVRALKDIEKLPVTLHLGGHRESDFTSADLIVVNPAVRKDSPYLELARGHNVRVTAEMNIFFEHCPAPIIAVTGSNGKSTTAAMIAHILRANTQATYANVHLGGNIGQGSLLVNIKEITQDDLVVLELSSFQLHDMAQIKRSPHIALVTNIAPNHLDWHGTMEHYVAAKQNILRFQSSDDHAVLNRLDPVLAGWSKFTNARIHWYPSEQYEASTIELVIPGYHNQRNASAALAVANILNIRQEASLAALATFKGLPHRLELVAEIDGVSYFNDSIATTPESTIAAIDAFASPKILIIGGYDKKIPLTQLVRHLILAENPAKTPNVTDVILIGQLRYTLETQIESLKRQKNSQLPNVHQGETLQQAVQLAKQYAKPCHIVLLSPSAASYDMFQNFQDRGEQFRELVKRFRY